MANKALGQHWLQDIDVLERMATVARVSKTDTVLEIGPGHGTLTRVLCNAAKQVIAVELDEQLAERLSDRVEADNLVIHQGDIRQADFRDLPDNYKVVANIPYYLTSHLIQLLLAAQPRPQAIALLMQQEVAERLAAEPGELSVLGVSTQLQADVVLDRIVAAELFQPPPKVSSQIVILTPKKPAVPFDLATVLRLVKIGFSSRRKTLVNNLAHGLHVSKSQAAALVAELGYDQTTRAQEVRVEDWIILSQLYAKP